MPANNIPTVLVIFGATGDLMIKKIVPALYNLYLKGKLPKLFRIIGVARRDMTDAQFEQHVTQILLKSHEESADSENIAKFAKMCVYHQGKFEDRSDYDRLATELGRIDGSWKVCSNKLFYLAVPPQYYETIFIHLAGSGLTIPCGPDEGWTRVLVEKPFGRDLATAEKLDLLLAQLFKEEQIYRIDHYLAKEMLQNILSFRFSNNLMEQSWNSRYIEKITVRFFESLGVEDRGKFYDGVGALRDVGQNHLLQMLAHITMDHPRNFKATSVRAKRSELLSTLKTPSMEDITTYSMRAQYDGYTEIDGVAPDSQTETFFRVRAYLENARWRGVPITLEGGKRLKNPVKEIIVTFKHAMPCLCPPDIKTHYKDRVIFSLEPSEKILVYFLAKKPGLDMEVEPRRLEFTYRQKKNKSQYVEEYEKLLLDCIEGNQLLFVNTDEVKAMWRYTDPIVQAWDAGQVPLLTYKPGTDDIRRQIEQAKITIRSNRRVMNKEVVIVGLGKMGAASALQLAEKGWMVYGYNRTASVTQALESEGIVGIYDFANIPKSHKGAPRVYWLMVPAGDPVDEMITALTPHLNKGDMVIDAGNSNYVDTKRRGEELAKKGIVFFDVGFSGGPGGARYGACLMVGGARQYYDYIFPLLRDLARPDGVQFFEGVGAGHYVKMVHNGIEYGMMQALGEGFEILKNSEFNLNLEEVARVYNHGSVIESRLVRWLENAYRVYGRDLSDVSGSIGQGGGGPGQAPNKGEAVWTVEAAEAMGIATPVISDSIDSRATSRSKPTYQHKVVNALRNQFGGHKV